MSWFKLLTSRPVSHCFPISLILAVALSASGEAAGQTVGVIWDPPAELSLALADLDAISEVGFSAVRLPDHSPTGVLKAADSLGLAIYVDLPVRFLTSIELVQSKDSLLMAMERAASTGYVTAVGLAFAPQSTEDATCRVLRDLAAATPLVTYIVSWDRPPDLCQGSVDLVLYDSPEHDALASDVFGRPVTSDLYDQAAFLAQRLAENQSSTPLFLHRWRDQVSVAGFQSDPGGERYGITADRNEARPAATVIHRILEEGRFVFERPPHSAAPRPSSQTVVVGWLLVLVLLGLYVRSPRFRPMFVRYFTGHSFYRTAVMESRNTMTGSSITLMICFGIAGGIIAMEAGRVLPSASGYHAVWNWSPVPVRMWLDAVFSGSRWWILALSSSMAIAGFLWVILIHVTIGRQSNLGIGQILVLTVWPQWPVFASVPAFMVLAGLPIEAASPLLAPLLGTSVLASCWGSVRATIDLGRAGRLGPIRTLVLWLLSPPAVGAGLAILFLTRKPGAVSYLWAAAFWG